MSSDSEAVNSISEVASSTSEVVNYDDEPLAQVPLGETEFRFDSGRAGTALCISSREAGTWLWSFVAEAKWDNTTLRCKELDRPTREILSKAFREALIEHD